MLEAKGVEFGGDIFDTGVCHMLCGSLLLVYLLVLALPGTREFFELAVPNGAALVLILLGAAIAIGFLWLTDDRFVPTVSRSRAA